VLVNIIYGAISFNAIPLSCSWFLFYPIPNRKIMSKPTASMKKISKTCFNKINITSFSITPELTNDIAVQLIMERLSFELFDKEQPIEKKRKN